MDPITLAYKQIIERFVQWAQSEENIRTAVVIGSRARTDHPADEWADLDIVILARDLSPYLKEAQWVGRFGQPWITFLEPTPGGPGMERRVLYEGGLDVDFAFFPQTVMEQALKEALPPEMNHAFGRGFRVLLDKDGFMDLLKTALVELPPPPRPTPEQVLNVINDFWYHAVWTAKHLRRGELWWAKGSCDGHLKELLRQMLEWHAHAMKGPGHDTWMRGRFLEEWADPRAVEGLKQAFAHFDEQDIWRNLLATMDLFRWVAVETAEKSGYAYPTLGDERATELVRELYKGRG
jgi:aminoglycoside 6-adenylyltransferase